MKQDFSEQKYFGEYKKIRNKFRRFNTSDLFQASLRYLDFNVRDTLDRAKRQPWLALLLMKWVLIDERMPLKGRELNEQALRSLLQQIQDLSTCTKGPAEFGLRLFIKTTAFHQFYLQESFNTARFARQSMIFDQLPDNHRIKNKFTELTGLSPEKFNGISLIILVRLFTSRGSFIPYSWLSQFDNTYSKAEFESYILVMSKTLKDLKNWLRHSDDGLRPSGEYYEPTPFIKSPFIREKYGLRCVYPEVFYRSVENFVYDLLREESKEHFMHQFGSIFEEYIASSLDNTDLDFVREQELKKLLPKGSKVVDFLIKDGGARIFVDAKATEMSTAAMITDSFTKLESETKNTLRKAFEQAHDTLSGLDSAEYYITPDNYLLVITYKEHFLGNGADYYAHIAKEKWDRVYESFSGGHPIPAENVYFMNVDDFDLLMEVLKKGELSLLEVLKKAIENDKSVESRRLVFHQHLAAMADLEHPEWLQERFDSVYAELEDSITAKNHEI